jgi:flavin reductase (DIM6/NTAB) family NADH-FMN oxidoreductase RutF
MGERSFETVEVDTLGPREAYALLTQTIVPRPIAWVSTLSADGVRNLAPFSFFNGLSARPPLLSVAVGSGRDGEKDTVRNLRERGELVVNVVDAASAERMVRTAGAFGPEVDEFEVAGVAALPSLHVAPPRVADSPVQFECDVAELIDRPAGAAVTLVVARVLCVHLERRLRGEAGVDPVALDPLARLGGALYARLREPFALARPD